MRKQAGMEDPYCIHINWIIQIGASLFDTSVSSFSLKKRMPSNSNFIRQINIYNTMPIAIIAKMPESEGQF